MSNSTHQMLSSHGSLLCEIVREGFKAYLTNYSRYLADHSKATRAGLIHDHMVAVAKMLLPPEFRSTNFLGRSLFTYNSSAVFQLKRLNTDLKPSNYKTATSNSIYEVGEIDGLPGIGAALPLITIGYVPDELWSEPLAIIANQIVNQTVVWSKRLDDVDDLQRELPLPIHSDDSVTRQSKARLKHPDVSQHGGVKKDRADKSRHDDNGEAGKWADAS